MSCRAGFVWETPQPFVRFIEDCGITCELVTPYMLAAPFYRGSFTCLIIPTGFGNPAYCRLLPALRASADRIRRYVENGGNLLVFGAMIDKDGVYDWLPFPVTYRHGFSQRNVLCRNPGLAGDLVRDYDPTCIECDGIFPTHARLGIGSELVRPSDNRTFCSVAAEDLPGLCVVDKSAARDNDGFFEGR